MAQVPDFSIPQVHEQGLPGARVESVASPDLLDAGAVEKGKLAGAVMSAGVGAAQVAFHMQQRENADTIFKAESADKEAYLAYEADLRQNRQGDAAKGAAQDTAAWWKDRITKNTEGMNAEQKRIYTQRIMPVQLQAIHGVSQYESQQTEISHDNSWNANKANTINLAAANPEPGVVGTSMAEIKRLNAYQAKRKGWTPEVLQAQNEQDITNLHKQAIETLAQQNPADAEAYYKAHELEIAGSQRAELGKFARQATAARTGADAAEAEWKANGPQNDTDASNIDAMEKNIREKFKSDPYAKEVALKNLRELDATRDKAIKARDSQRTATVNSMLMGGTPLAAVQQTAAWAALDGTEQRKIVEHEESIENQREARAAARESRAYTAQVRAEHEKELAGTEVRMRLSDPDKLIRMDRNDVINLRTTLGNENTQKLLDRWDLYTKNGTALSEAKLDNDQFNAFATRAGLDIKSKDADTQKRVIDTRDRVERIIGAEQQARKKPLSRAEKDEILQREIDNTVMQHNVIMRDQPVPVVALPDDKMASAYVVVGGERVRLSSIPMDYRAELTAARRAKGLPTNERVIAEMWLKKQAARKKSLVPASVPEQKPEQANDISTPNVGP